MAAIHLVAALAAAGVTAAVAAVAEVSRPCASQRHASGEPEESCTVVDARGSQSTMLMQVNVMHRKFSSPEEFREGVQQTAQIRRDSPLARLLRRAKTLSEASGQPFEYLMDVDYIHDANNPLDNPDHPDHDRQRNPGESWKDSDRAQKEPSPAPDGGEESLQPSHKEKASVLHSECVTRIDPRVAATTFMEVALPGTPCVFGLDARDEGLHCIMEGDHGDDYGSYGWCYTAQDRSAWGSCSETCPLSGSHAMLEKRIDSMSELLDDLIEKVKDKKDCGTSKTKKRKPGLELLEKLTKAKKPQK